MKHVAFAIIAAIALTACSKEPTAMDLAFADAEKVIQSIVVPEFCTDTFRITDFGASTDADPMHNSFAINQTIDSCSAVGGGCVVVPQGVWPTGPIVLKSNVNLVVSNGATLQFSTVHEHYMPAVLTRWEGIDCYNTKPLIYAYDAVNVAITGKGIIDGGGNEETWWYMKGRTENGWHEGLVSQKAARNRLFEADVEQLDVSERHLDVEDGLRPQLINIFKCENVLIEGVTLRNSPFWVIHPLLINNLTVRSVNIESHGPNSDGCDPESCSNVLIENCFFDTGDDCIAIKSGRNYDGRRWNKPSENIIVRNCRMKNGHGGVVLGSEISGGFRNLWVENCQMSSPELDRVIRIKTSDCRGGVIENVFVRNVEVGECKESVLKINLQYEPDELCNRNFPPIVRNINLENITSEKSRYGVYIVGLDGTENVDGVTVSNCHFNNVADGNSIADAVNVHFNNLYINGNNASDF